MSNSVYYYYDKNESTKGDWSNVSNWWIDAAHTINAPSLPSNNSDVYVLPGSKIHKANNLPIIRNLKVDNAILDIDMVVKFNAMFVNGASFGDPSEPIHQHGDPSIRQSYYQHALLLASEVIFVDKSSNYDCIAADNARFYSHSDGRILTPVPFNVFGAFWRECNSAPFVQYNHSFQTENNGDYPANLSFNTRYGIIMASMIFNDACYNEGIIIKHNLKTQELLLEIEATYNRGTVDKLLYIYDLFTQYMGVLGRNGPVALKTNANIDSVFHGYSMNGGLIAGTMKNVFNYQSTNRGKLWYSNNFFNPNPGTPEDLTIGGNMGQIYRGGQTIFNQNHNKSPGQVIKTNIILYNNSENYGTLNPADIGTVYFYGGRNYGRIDGIFTVYFDGTMVEGIIKMPKIVLKRSSVGGPTLDIDCGCGEGIIITDEFSTIDPLSFINPYFYYVRDEDNNIIATVLLGTTYNGEIPKQGNININTTHITTEYPSVNRISISACCEPPYIFDSDPVSPTFGTCILIN